MMTNKFPRLKCFKKSKFFFFGVQPCIALVMVVCTFILLYRTTPYPSLTCQPNINASFQLYIVNYGCNNKEHKFGKKVNQIVERPENATKKQAVCTKVENLTNAKGNGMNATHICGILMEPVNINYTQNIYFTVKTTHKYYTNRLLLLMLTWLQTVDKDKVCM